MVYNGRSAKEDYIKMKAGVRKINGISGSTLKIIALISMLIDHIAASLIMIQLGIHYSEPLYQTFVVMRHFIGRLAFPIYCFLLVEGFQKTGNRSKYAGRLFLFALISEVPFDLAFNRCAVYPEHQNVFFTLLAGVLVIWGMEEMERRISVLWLRWSGYVVIVAAGAFLAEAFAFDYGVKGILPIVVLYLFRQNKAGQIAAGFVAFLWEYTASAAFVLVALYNGKRGMKLKYVFYAFYPVHLLILSLLSLVLFK